MISGIWFNANTNWSDDETWQFPSTVEVILKSLNELNWITGNGESDELINV